jgi:hypothetical protein
VSAAQSEGEGVMETDKMGGVLVTAKIENNDDLVLAKKGLLPADQVRSDFVVDSPGRRLIGNPAPGGEHMIEMY